MERLRLKEGCGVSTKHRRRISGHGFGIACTVPEQLLHINMQRFRGGLVFKAHRLCVSLNSRLGTNKEEEEYRARAEGRRKVVRALGAVT